MRKRFGNFVGMGLSKQIDRLTDWQTAKPERQRTALLEGVEGEDGKGLPNVGDFLDVLSHQV